MKATKPIVDKTKHALTKMISKVTGRAIASHPEGGCPPALHTKLCSARRDIPKFDLDGQNMWVRMIGAHDGDSVSVSLLFADKIYKTNLRLLGLDTPEIRTKDLQEKRKAIMARNRLLEWATGDLFPINNEYTDKQIKDIFWSHPTFIFIRCEEDDKYGRILARLFKSETDTESINDILVKEGHADEYFGETKIRSWADAGSSDEQR